MDQLSASNKPRQPIESEKRSPNGYARVNEVKSRVGGFWMRLLCVAVALIALIILARQLGLGIARVRQGEITVAQMFGELGDWLRGISPDESEDARQPSNEQESINSDTPLSQDAPSEEDGQQAARQLLYEWDRTKLPEGVRAVIPVDLAAEVSEEQQQAALLWQWSDDPIVAGQPLVLVIHTHTSEGYTPRGVEYWDTNEVVGRSLTRQASVVGVGEAFVRELERLGVPTCHVTASFDGAGNAGSFDRAAAQISRYLEMYPTIRYVIDLHRDAGLASSGDVLRAVTLCEGEVLAQIRLLVSGQEAYGLAAALAYELNADDARLCRPIEKIELPSSWQWEGVLAIRAEVGTAGNSPDEAARAAKALAQAMAEGIKRGKPEGVHS